MRAVLVSVMAVLVLGKAAPARAHPLAPSMLSFEPHSEGTVTMRWRTPAKRPVGQSIHPVVPERCKSLGSAQRQRTEDQAAIVETTELRCTPPDMEGATIRVEGLTDSTLNVVVRMSRADGSVDHSILDARTPELTISAQHGGSHSFFEYLMLGVEHLLTGWDHLTFVLGLLVLFGWHRRLLAAVTAFTVGHSLTLALSVLGILSVPTTLVEALIALTIVVLALEIQASQHGPVWTHPWTLPAALGLLHGLGFASALFGAGLPSDEIPLALLGFNLGLEVAQLGVISVAWLSFAAIRSAIPPGWRSHHTVPAYAIGSLAAFWTIERTLAVFGIFV